MNYFALKLGGYLAMISGITGGMLSLLYLAIGDFSLQTLWGCSWIMRRTNGTQNN